MKRSQGPILVLFGRPPRQGEAKTRLAASLGEPVALDLYIAFLRDTIELVRRTSPSGIRPAIAWAQPSEGAIGDRSEYSSCLGVDLGGFEMLQQQGDDLGQRMLNCFAFLLARGHDRVAIIGSDTPSLPLEHVLSAFDLLRDRDLVLGPSRDGGYYLIGARSVIPEIFRGIPWGSGRVLAETLAILKILGLPRVLLPEWEDVDTAEDLASLRASLASSDPSDPTARHTRAALARIPPVP